jgi:hypothetical protein
VVVPAFFTAHATVIEGIKLSLQMQSRGCTMKSSFAPDTVSLMGRVCDEAYGDLDKSPPGATKARRRDIATRVMAAVSAGERNPLRLKAVALGKQPLSDRAF